MGHKDYIEVDQKRRCGRPCTCNIILGKEMGMLRLYRSNDKNKMDQVQARTCVQGNEYKARVQFLKITTILRLDNFDAQNWWAPD